MPYVPGCLAESVSAWKLSGKSSPLVDLALSAIALVIYSHAHQQPAAAVKATQTYHELLRMMQDRISDLSNTEDFDAMLLTILLMGRYEGATHGPEDFKFAEQFKHLRTWSHHDGSMAVLKLWHDSSDRRPPTFIIKQARRGLIRSAFLRNIPLPEWMLEPTRFGEQGLELQYDRIEVGLVKLRNLTACLEKESHPGTSKVDELCEEAEDLDEALQDWIAQIPSKYSYKRHTLEDNDAWPRLHFLSPTVHSFTKPGYSAVWLQYFSTRILSCSTYLRILKRCQQHEQVRTEQKQRVHDILKATGEHLAACIPFPLGRFKVRNAKAGDEAIVRETSITIAETEEVKPYLANIVIWPLSVASGLKGVPEE